jgi:hypothetical protein
VHASKGAGGKALRAGLLQVGCQGIVDPLHLPGIGGHGQQKKAPHAKPCSAIRQICKRSGAADAELIEF